MTKKIEHKSWCWSVWTPVETTGRIFRCGELKGLPRPRKRNGSCNCGAVAQRKRKTKDA